MSNTGLKYISFIILVFVVIIQLDGLPVRAQGSIFGTVQNSDLSVPANSDIVFFSYINGTDEEIRTES